MFFLPGLMFYKRENILPMSNRFSVIRRAFHSWIRNVLSLLMENPAIIFDAILITQKQNKKKLPTFFPKHIVFHLAQSAFALLFVRISSFTMLNVVLFSDVFFFVLRIRAISIKTQSLPLQNTTVLFDRLLCWNKKPLNSLSLSLSPFVYLFSFDLNVDSIDWCFYHNRLFIKFITMCTWEFWNSKYNNFCEWWQKLHQTHTNTYKKKMETIIIE